MGIARGVVAGSSTTSWFGKTCLDVFGAYGKFVVALCHLWCTVGSNPTNLRSYLDKVCYPFAHRWVTFRQPLRTSGQISSSLVLRCVNSVTTGAQLGHISSARVHRWVEFVQPLRERWVNLVTTGVRLGKFRDHWPHFEQFSSARIHCRRHVPSSGARWGHISSPRAYFRIIFPHLRCKYVSARRRSATSKNAERCYSFSRDAKFYQSYLPLAQLLVDFC